MMQDPVQHLPYYLDYYAGSIFQAPTGYAGDPAFTGYQSIDLVFQQGGLFAELYVYEDVETMNEHTAVNGACTRSGELRQLCPYSGSDCEVVHNSDGTCTYRKCLPA
jgi:hypothetical protein